MEAYFTCVSVSDTMPELITGQSLYQLLIIDEFLSRHDLDCIIELLAIGYEASNLFLYKCDQIVSYILSSFAPCSCCQYVGWSIVSQNRSGISENKQTLLLRIE